MSLTVNESWELANLSVNAGNLGNQESTMSKTYVVDDAEDEIAASEAAYNYASEKIYDTKKEHWIPKKSATVIERCGEKTWKVQVDYAFSANSSGGDSDREVTSVSFECSTSTIHVVKAYDQSCVYRNPKYTYTGDADKIPIGWNGEAGALSEATGVDVPSAECREQYKKILSFNKITSSSWKRNVASCVGRVNSVTFKGWKPGEMMFLGCSYDTPLRGTRNVTVNFNFAIRVNENNVKVCGHSIGDVKGHEYVWCVFGDNVSGNSVNREVKFIFKARVCKTSDFSKLGL